MEQKCTCGATAPPNAVFCPMCGRPLQERQPEPAQTDVAEELRQVAAKPAESRKIAFANPDALRSSYFGALVAALLVNIPFINWFCFLWYPAAGFLTVHNYRKRTGEFVPTRSGAKLGFITGVLTFTISLFLGAVTSLIPRDNGGLAEAFRQQIEQTPAQEEVKRQMLDLLENPVAVAVIVLLALVTNFVVAVGFTTTGGALGAKVLSED